MREVFFSNCFHSKQTISELITAARRLGLKLDPGPSCGRGAVNLLGRVLITKQRQSGAASCQPQTDPVLLGCQLGFIRNEERVRRCGW